MRWGVCIILILITGCATVRPSKQVTTNQNAIEKEDKKVSKIFNELIENANNQKTQTAILAAGTQRSLNQITNPPVEVTTAQELNERIINVVGSPNLDDLQKINKIVDLLNSKIADERKRGEKLLGQRDSQIVDLQKEKDDIQKRHADQIKTLTDVAKQSAKTADQNQAAFDSMSGFFGLNAVFWGLKRFFISTFTFLIIFGVLFIILRLLSTVNPIAGTIFSIFDLIGSIILGIIKGLTPKAFEMAKYTSSAVTENYKQTLVKIVDTIETLKQKQKDNPSITYPLTEVLGRLSQNMNDSNKNTIEDILVEEKWKTR